jgi:DNA-binding ferritin-like protein
MDEAIEAIPKALAAQARDLAGEANHPESQDLMIGRITLHQKTIWMLKRQGSDLVQRISHATVVPAACG